MGLMRLSLVLCASALFLTACSEQAEQTSSASQAVQTVTQPQAPSMRPVQKATNARLVEGSYLRQNMPAQAMAYLRVPSLFGLADVRGTIYDAVHQSEPYSASLISIKQGMVDNLLDSLSGDPGLQLLAQVLIKTMRSPLEIAVLPPADASVPMPAVLGTVVLDIDKPEALNGLISRLVLASPMVKIAQAVDATGNGFLTLNGLPVQLFFDAPQRRLFFLSGVIQPADYLQQLLSTLSPAPQHPMHSLETRVDTSGQGLYAWFAPKAIIKTAQETGQAWGMFLAAGGLSEAEGIALGAGVAGGKQRLRLEFQMPHVGLRRLLPAVDQTLTFETAGKPGTLASFSLPSHADLLAIEQIMASMLPPESMQKYTAARLQIEKRLGVSLQDLLTAIGPELIFVSDQAGQYSALKINDKPLFEKTLQRLVETLGMRLEERTINGQQYRHLEMPAWIAEEAENALSAEDKASQHPLLKRLASLPGHLYWIEEGDYLVSAVVPQILIDRGYISERNSVAEWLRDDQKVDAHQSLLLASAQMQGLSRFMYSLELQGLLSLADLAGAEVDLFSLPTAREVGLAEVTGYSAKLDSSEQLLALELSYDHNPAEVLLGGNGMSSVVVVGILAAVAIPAYQDYTIRAKVAQGLEFSAYFREAIVNYYLENGSLPAQQQVDELIAESSYPDIQSIQYDPDSGRLTITYSIERLGEQNRLFLSPGLKDGQVVWSCSADIESKYLPSSCRE